MAAFRPLLDRLRDKLHELVDAGMPVDELEHARQVAQIVAVLHEAFSAAGFLVTLVGGAAIEIHAPGIYRSGDLDVVVEKIGEGERTRDDIFRGLGFVPEGRHWRLGDLFVEVVQGPVEGPAEQVRAGDAVFRVVTKEVVLRDRIVGFKHWRYTAYGQQAVDMLAAYGDQLELSWLLPELEREDAEDALRALQELARSDTRISADLLKELLESLE